jgi:hypothetical protein
MRAPSATDLLLAWERGLDRSSTQRALALLGACSPEITQDRLAALPIGARDTLLLRLRKSLFGNSVSAVSRCPKCSEKLDVAFSIDDVLDRRAVQMDLESVEFGVRTHQLRTDGYDITYRLPTSADLLAISETLADIVPQAVLLQRCIIDVQLDGESAPVNELPDSITAAVSKKMADADPQAQIELALVCPGCSHAWHALFDVAAFLWSEVHAWAKRILREVHTLARAYGWREADILAMSARRRQMYLDLVRS